jgi:site-specific recombinase XerD
MRFLQGLKQYELWKGQKSNSKTIKGYSMMLRQFGVFVHDMEIEEIELKHVLFWFDLMKRYEWDRNSFIPKAIALVGYFRFFKKQGYNVLDPELIPVPDKIHKRPNIATREQYELVLNAIPNNNDPRSIRNRLFLKMLWDTGARNGELLSLNLVDIDTDNNKAVIKTEKNKGTRPFREIYWTEETGEDLEAWLNKRAELLQDRKQVEALFISATGLKVGKRLTLSGSCEMLRKVSRKAGLDKTLNAHSFRHRKGRYIASSGGGVSDVANVLGHASYLSSKPYLDLWGKDNEDKAREFLD